MADLIEALHNLARERARGGPSPLAALRSFPARQGARISHLGISQRLSQAWVTVTGAPFRPHQSLALSALRRGEPFALVGGAAARQTLHLLALELLRAEAPATAILVAQDELAAAVHRDELDELVRALGEPLRVGIAQGAEARAAIGAHLVVATPHTLHERLLRHHDRAWSALWSRMRLLLIADAHCYGGLAAVHLSWLLMRARRLAGAGRPPQLAATIAPAADADTALAQIAGEPWRLFPADDGPLASCALALWRPGGERLRETAALALGLTRGGKRIHVICDPVEARQIAALVGPDVPAVSVGPSPLPAEAQILAGAALAAPYLRQCLDGARLTALVLGDDPADRALGRLAARDPGQIPLLDGPEPVWVAAPGNAYVTAQHLICAAAERPVAADEARAWGAESVIARLESHGQLVGLPDDAWQPLPEGGDVYAGFDLRSAADAPGVIRDEQGAPLGALDVAAFDRWGFTGAALPPLRGGLRVVARDEHALELTARAVEQRRTLPLRRCSVRVRDRRERRTVRGRELGWGRVVLDEEIYGYREVAGANAPAERALNPPLSGSLAAPACWIDLPAGLGAAGQIAGWCLVAALPLRTMSALADLVPAYDAEARRIYFVDAQPGGNGVSAWLFTSLEELLPLAYDVALDCKGDPLLEPLARADIDWLLTMLAAERPAPAARPAHEEPPPRVEAPPPPRPVEPPAPPAALELPPPQPRREPAPVEPPPARLEVLSVEPRRAEPPRAEPPLVEPPLRAEPPPASTPQRASSKGRRPPPETPRERPPRRESTPRGKPPRQTNARAAPAPPAPAPPPTLPAPASSAPAEQPPLPLDGDAPASPPAPPEREQPERRELPLEPLPDAAAMVARLRRLRERRDGPPAPDRPARPATGDAEPRFHSGDRIVCTPYGRGEVVASHVEDEREILVVRFADHGELTIDAAVNAARPDDDAATPPAAADDF
jgi:DEAD/DEAH box helicase domain-containing protein